MQTNKTLRVTIVLTLLLAGAVVVHAAVLDGTKWKVKVVPDKAAAAKGAKAFDDELIFANGEFTSRALLRKGFKSSKYHAEAEPHEAEFEAEQVGTTNSVATWTGEIRGTNTMGGLVWSQKSRGNFIYEFTGTKN
jgi:hypothetical protein